MSNRLALPLTYFFMSAQVKCKSKSTKVCKCLPVVSRKEFFVVPSDKFNFAFKIDERDLFKIDGTSRVFARVVIEILDDSLLCR